MSRDPIVHLMRLLTGITVLSLFFLALFLLTIVMIVVKTSPVLFALTLTVNVIAISAVYLIGYAFTERVTEEYV